ncbi:MAG: TRAP transporter large permease [Hyphomonadaceae bacterium]|nr:TRAP transporter large permease [Hyphomonadaceae bacterium]
MIKSLAGLGILAPLAALAAGVGLAWALGAAGVLSFVATDRADFLAALPQRAFTQVDVFALMAMPMFILVGELMNRGGITRVLIDFSTLLVGRARGGLGHVNVATSIFLSGISGSAMADAAALSTTLVPAMRERGYKADYAGALTAAASMIGPVIPPSIIMIFYGAIMSLDVGALFAAAIVPGLVLAGSLFVANAAFARAQNHPRLTERPPLVPTVLRALPALAMPVVIMCGIAFGLTTPTEAGVIAVLTALAAAAFYRQLSLDMLTQAMKSATVLTGAIFTLFVTGALINFLAALLGLPALVSAWVDGVGLDLNGFMLLLLGLFLLAGTVLDTQIALVLMVPILAPAAYALGADPIHLGVLICLTITLGLISPPLGGVVLIISSTTGVSYWRLMHAVLPFFVIEIVVILILAFAPELTLALPRALGML